MHRIVVGVDGSENSRQALRWAIEEAEGRKAQLEVVHAWEPPFGPTWGTLGADVAAYEAQAQRLLEDEVSTMAAASASTTVDQQAVRGSAASVLVELSKQADLIVVGARGHGGFAGLRWAQSATRWRTTPNVRSSSCMQVDLHPCSRWRRAIQRTRSAQHSWRLA